MFIRRRILRTFSNCSRLSTATGAAKRESKKELVIRKHGEFLYGVAPCTAALHLKRRKIYAVYQKLGFVEKRAASKRPALGDSRLRKVAEERKVDFNLVEKNVLDRLSGNRPHQGIVLDVAPLNFRRMDITECKLSEKERAKKPIWILLDEVQDPMNLGAILRSCYYLGVSRVIASLKRCCPLSPTVSKASAGAMELIPVYSVSHLERFLQEAKANSWSILGSVSPDITPNKADSNKDSRQENEKKRKTILHIDCRDYIKQGPTLLVLGNEGHGLHHEVEEQCEAMLTVKAHRDLPPGFDSLNVGVATGILLHSLQN